MTSNSWA